MYTKLRYLASFSRTKNRYCTAKQIATVANVNFIDRRTDTCTYMECTYFCLLECTHYAYNGCHIYLVLNHTSDLRDLTFWDGTQWRRHWRHVDAESEHHVFSQPILITNDASKVDGSYVVQYLNIGERAKTKVKSNSRFNLYTAKFIFQTNESAHIFQESNLEIHMAGLCAL